MNPGPYQQPEGTFQIIVKIHNPFFLDELKDIVRGTNEIMLENGCEYDVMSLEYESGRGYWFICGINECLKDPLEPFLADYSGIKGELKSPKQWDRYKSYGNTILKAKELFGGDD